MPVKLVSSDLGIVLVGDFNPRIFLPSWFVDQGLLEEGEVSESSVDVVHPDICQFKSDWCTLVVNKHRLQVTSSHAPLVRVADLVSKVFGEYLILTPVSAFAINHSYTFDCGSEAVMDQLGKALAPQQPWGDWGKKFEGESSERGGLFYIEMIQKKVEDRDSGYIKAIVKPAEQSHRSYPFCINVAVNDHFDIVDNPKSADKAAKLLYKNYDNSLATSKLISSTIRELAEAKES